LPSTKGARDSSQALDHPGNAEGLMASFPFSILGQLGGRVTGGQPMRFEEALRGKLRLIGPDQNLRNDGRLAQMVESEIIPRLMLAHQALKANPEASNDTHASLGDETTDRFARMVVSKEPESLIAYVGTLLRDGISMEAIFLELLVPAARRLGEYWDEDSLSFADVTIGLGRLQQVVRALGYNNGSDIESDRPSPTALFAPAPGEQHMFGLFIVEDSFRRAGWRTWIESSPARRNLIDTAGAHWFDVFGVSASKDAKAEDIADLVKVVRESSRNPDVFVMTGGRLFIEHPELVAQVGADATAIDGGEALLVANEALALADNGLRRLAMGS
jgi:methanogenic corrinoid protein MtbC1